MESRQKQIGRVVIICLFLLALSVAPAVRSTAQEDYPLPPGNPDTWGTGTPLTFPVQGEAPPAPGAGAGVPPGREGAAAAFPTLPPQGNEGQNQPSTPSGEAQEVYTGNGPFGGIAGTGITMQGPVQNR